MDKATLLGIAVGVGGGLARNLIEGGKISQIAQPTAAMIVIGGTVGATLIQFPLPIFMRAMKMVKSVFIEPPDPSEKLVDEIVGYATTARKDGIVALEAQVEKASDAFLGRALMMAIDGADSAAMRESLETSIGRMEQQGDDAAKVFETAGG